jgi:hypothetical protein
VQRDGNIAMKVIFKGLFFLAFAVLPFISFAQNTDSTLSVLKSGRRPRFQVKPFDFYQSNKQFSKSPFSIFSIKGSRNQIDFSQNQLISSQQLGDISISPSQAFSLSDYSNLQNKDLNRSYWNDYSKSLDGNNSVQSRGLFPKIELLFNGSKKNTKIMNNYLGKRIKKKFSKIDISYIKKIIQI